MRVTSFAAFLLATSATAAFAQDTRVAAADPVADTIVITGRRAAKTARDEQRVAPNLINIQAAEDIVKYPDFNAAESLSRIPGVSLAIDTGEGRFVNIRGIDNNLNGTTFGGVTLLNTQPGGTYFGGGGRAVELDTIPVGSIDRLEVRKTGLPDQEAEGIGGSVELTPRTAFGIKKPFIEGILGGGYETFRKDYQVFAGEAAIGTIFGPDKQFAIVLDGSYHTDRRGFDDLEPGLLDAGADANDPLYRSTVLDSVDFRRYNYNRRRFGFGGELRWDPNLQSTYYIRANDAGYTESVNRQILNYSGLGDSIVVDPANPNGLIATGVGARVSLRDEQETHLNFIASAGGRNDLGAVIVDYQAAYTSSTYHRDYDRNSTFGSPASFTVRYDNNTNTSVPTIVPTGFDPNDPTQFTLAPANGFNNTTERAFDREYSGVVNLTIPTALLSGDGHFKVGGKLRFRDKIDTPNQVTFGSTRPAFGAPATPLPAIPLTSVLGGGPYNNFYDGNYAIGYSPDAGKIRASFIGNPAFIANTAANAQRNAGGFFNDTENIYAAYAEYQGEFGKLGVLAGVRVENTDATYRGTSVITNVDKTVTFVPVSNKSNYTNSFPTVQLSYKIKPDFLARATYSTGISRPGFLQLVAGSRVDIGNQSVSIGNPNLQPFTANSFDGALEYYLPHAGIISVGVYDKEIKNYVLQRVLRNQTYAGIPGNQTVISSYSNVPDAYVRGVEAQYVQKFAFLPAPFDGLGFDGNITYNSSKVEIRPGEFSALPGTSELTYNVAGFYEAHKVQVRVALLNVDATIFQIGGSSGLDVFQDKRLTLDATGSYQLLRNVAVYFNAKNLLNTPLRYYEGLPNRQIQREFYDTSYEAGIRFKF